MDGSRYSKYVYIGVFLMLLVLSFFIIFPFITAVLTGLVFAYVFYPVYKKINAKTRRRTLSSLIVLLIVLLLVTVPVVFVVNMVAKQSVTIYFLARQRLVGGNLLDINCDNPQISGTFICNANTKIQAILTDPKVRTYMDVALSRFGQFVIDKTTDFFLSTPKFLASLFITFFIMFFLWRDWDKLIKKMHQILHLRKHHEAHIMRKVNDMTYAIVYGNVIVALIQGAIGSLGFFIFGVPSPVVWGLVMAFFSLIHIVGTPVVWVPASLLLILDGISSASSNGIFRGVGLLIYGILIISTIDNLLKPKIIGSRGNIHPVLVLIGVLGGISLFGLIGVVIGPLILGLFNVFIDVFEEEMKFNS